MGTVLVEREIGRGANARVYKAKHEILGRTVAIKLWLPRRNNEESHSIQATRAVSEIQKLSPYMNNDIVKVYNAGESLGLVFLVQEYFEAGTLRNWLLENNPGYKKRISQTDLIRNGLNRGMFHRWEVAQRVFDVVEKTTSPLAYHGDLHLDNVLFRTDFNSGSYDFRIIDFGSSYKKTDKNGRPLFSLERHWRVLLSTFDALLYPYSPSLIAPDVNTKSIPPDDIVLWIAHFRKCLSAIASVTYQSCLRHKVSQTADAIIHPKHGHVQIDFSPIGDRLSLQMKSLGSMEIPPDPVLKERIEAIWANTALTMPQQLHTGPVYFTDDWHRARQDYFDDGFI